MKNCVKKLLMAALFLGALWNARADAAGDGAAAFAKGDYSAAVRAFETAVASAKPSAGLYYNLAMAQIKDGQRPRAGLSLRRALMLDPSLTDARMALSDIERSQGLPRPPFDWRAFVAEKAPLQVLTVTGCALAWTGAFLFLFAIFKSGRKLLPIFFSGFLLIAGAALFLTGVLSDPRFDDRQVAVVLAADGVTLLSAPADQSATVTRLPAGASLRILRHSGDWAYCQVPAGAKGWTLSNSLESVVPSA